ncbi:GAP family protein [Kribbella sp. NPDC050241]|uniref:GAP family protein n=1 Tax=Kribbella sp. NPDC050241 TaxID=3364115 RepID=UPI0037BABADC
MGQALLQLIPLALAAALSSVPITATIFILLSESRSRSGLGFLVGTLLGTFATVALAAVAGHALPGRPREHDALVGKVEVAIGSALVLLGVVTLARRSRAGSGSGPSWLDRIGTFGTLSVFGIGLALNLRPKAILLAAAAGLAIVGADLAFRDNLGLVVFYTVIATCTVGVPIVATILFPRRMEPRLLSAKGWIAAHSTTVGAAMMILIGGFVVGVGLSS